MIKTLKAYMSICNKKFYIMFKKKMEKKNHYNFDFLLDSQEIKNIKSSPIQNHERFLYCKLCLLWRQNDLVKSFFFIHEKNVKMVSSSFPLLV